MTINTVCYFPLRKLLCTSSDELTFHVANGDYYFELHSRDAIMDNGKTVHVGDYEVMTREQFDECYPDFGCSQ